MRIKMPVEHYAILCVVLNQTTIDNQQLNAINFASFIELRKLLLSVVSKHIGTEVFEKNEKVTKKIPDSYGLLFFAAFNGIPMQGFESVVIKDMCKQVEKQLYKTGKYQFQQKP